MPFKKLLLPLAWALCLAMALAGCVSLQDPPLETAEIPTPQPTATPTPITNYTLFTAQQQGGADIWDTPVGQKLIELTHAYVDVEHLKGASLQSRVNAMIASGDYPDLISAAGEVERLAKAGALVDLQEMIASSSHVLRRYRQLEFECQKERYGGVYTLPTQRFSANALYTSIGYYINYDVLEHNGFAQLHTYGDYAVAIKNYMAQNPTYGDDPALKNIAFAMPMEAQVDFFYETAIALVGGFADDGKVLVRDATSASRFVATSSDVKDYLEFLNDLWKDKYIDETFFTMTEEEYQQALASGRVLACFDTRDRLQSAMDTLTSEGKTGRLLMACPVVFEGAITDYYTGTYTLNPEGISITAACRDPRGAFNLLDRLCADDAQKLMLWGVQGEDYTLEEMDGRQVMTWSEEQLAAYLDENQRAASGVGQFSFFPQAEPSEDEYYGQFDDYNWVNPLLQRRYLQTFYTAHERDMLEKMGMESFTDGFARPNVPTRDDGKEVSKRLEQDEQYAQTAQKMREIVEKYFIQIVKAPGHREVDALWEKMRGEIVAMSGEIEAYERAFDEELAKTQAYYGVTKKQ